MIGFLNPLLLLGLLGIAIPIAIHLLMRQRPRPQPWAAMRWLQAAMQAAQRRYRLTNLLLLLMRCLIAAMIALAVARPAISGLGASGSLVLVVDLSTSMGPTADGQPLATLAAQMAQGVDEEGAGSLAAWTDLSVITVGQEVLLRHEGSLASGLRLLEGLEVDTWAGGLDAIVDDGRAQDLAQLLPADATVVLVSDFRQDRATRLGEMLAEQVADLRRLRVGDDLPNALIAGVQPPADIRPGQSGVLRMRLQGMVDTARLQLNDGPAETVVLRSSELSSGADSGAEQWVSLQLPPLPAGRHMVQLTLEDEGLLADNYLAYPITVRDRIPALVVGDGLNMVAVALEADPMRIDYRRIDAVALASTPLPESGGIVLLHGRLPVGVDVLPWLREGGILWGSYDALVADPQLAGLLENLEPGAMISSGRVRSGEADLDENFARTQVSDLRSLRRFDEAGEVLLRAGESPLVVALPVGGGFMVVESDDLSADPTLRTTGAIPEWAVRTVRRLAARQLQVPVLESGQPLTQAMTLSRDGTTSDFAAGEPAHLAPGWWQNNEQNSGVVVLPNVGEGALRALSGSEGWTSAAILAPPQRGADWSWWLLLALLALLLGEGAVAAWAGRTYGR